MPATAVKIALNSVLRRLGYELRRYPGSAAALPVAELPPDFDGQDRSMWEAVAPHTMVPPQRVFSLRRAIAYVVKSGIPGAVVECGVWKGGCAMAMALSLVEAGDVSRDLYLYDTFEEGWPEGGEFDVSAGGKTAHEMYLDALAAGKTEEDLWARMGAVRVLMHGTGYPQERIHLVKGKVEDTIPGIAPEQIALLRLDTDWYESTRHELAELYPRLAVGGVLIIDDYAEWQGARKATEEFFAEQGVKMLLHRIDDGGCRAGVKG